MLTLARKIVAAAAKEVKDSATRTWLEYDERGTWERRAAELVELTAEKARAVNADEAEVIRQCGVFMALEALTAAQAVARKSA